jgi:hypothetical protein
VVILPSRYGLYRSVWGHEDMASVPIRTIAVKMCGSLHLTLGVLCVLAMASDPFPVFAQSAPVATYKIREPNVLKGRDGEKVRVAVTPDNSLLVALREPGGQGKILRLTGWETRRPKVETITYANTVTDRDDGVPSLDPILVDPTGRYAVIRSGLDNVGENESDLQKFEIVVAVIDLHDFTIAVRTVAGGGLAGGGLYFGRGGALTLDTLAKTGSDFEFAARVLRLPDLTPTATCEYTTESEPNPKGTWPAPYKVERTGDSCAAFIEAAHLSNVQDLLYRQGPDQKVDNLEGLACDYVDSNRTRDLELYRCGKEHLSDSAGDFGIMLWHALRVLSVPDGRVVLSLPLHIFDDKTVGVFAQAGDRGYLIKSHGTKLETYRLR